MRLCPSVEGSASPLITHRIGTDVCMARQRTFFHKCHRCIYRGKAEDWAPAEAPLAMINVHAAEEPAKKGVKKVALPQREPAVAVAEKPAKTKPATGKAAAKSAAKVAAKSAAKAASAEG